MASSKTGSPTSQTSGRSDQEYMQMLTKEFNSIPDREVPAPEPIEDDQISAMHQAMTITARPDKDSVDSRNAVIAKTIKSAMADMRLDP